jgi:hypothetical protein
MEFPTRSEVEQWLNGTQEQEQEQEQEADIEPYFLFKRGNCYVVVDRTVEPVTNFIMQILCYYRLLQADGTVELYVEVEGTHISGRSLPAEEMPFNKFQAMDWLSATWPDCYVLDKAKRDWIVRTVQRDSRPIPIKQWLTTTGFSVLDKRLIYAHKNGAITAQGSTPEILVAPRPGNLEQLCSLPTPVAGSETLTRVMRQVLSLFLMSSSNLSLSLVLMLAPFLAMMSYYRPMNLSLMLFGRSGTSKKSLAGLIRGFFSSAETPPLYFDISTSTLVERLKYMRHSVLHIDTVKYEKPNDADFEKLRKVVIAACHGTTRDRLSSQADIKPGVRLNTLLVFTGPPMLIKDSDPLYERLLYLRIEPGDVEREVLSRAQRAEKRGIFRAACATFIQDLIADDQDKVREDIERIVSDRRDEARYTHQMSPLRAEQFASLMVALDFLINFGRRRTSINKEGILDKIHKFAEKRLVTLFQEQAQLMGKKTVKEMLAEAIQEGLKPDIIGNTELCLIDSKTGNVIVGSDEPDARLGWYDSETTDLYIDATIDVKLFNKLLPSEYDKPFSESRRKFWIDMKAHGVLDSHNTNCLTRRKQFGGMTKLIHVYHVKLDLSECIAKYNAHPKLID